MGTTPISIAIGIVALLLVSLLVSCGQPPPGIQIPVELLPDRDSAIGTGAEFREIMQRRSLEKNEDRSDYITDVYYERFPLDSLFTGVGYWFTDGYLSSVTFSRDVDNQDVALDSIARWLVTVLRKQYGENFTVHERYEGHIKVPILLWRTQHGGYATLLYVPYSLVQEQRQKYNNVFNFLMLKVSREKNPWLEETKRYSKKTLGLENL